MITARRGKCYSSPHRRSLSTYAPTPLGEGRFRFPGEVGRLYEHLDLDAGLTIAQLARALGVQPGTVRTWATRGWRTPSGTHRRLTIVGVAERGHHRYRYGDGLQAERDTRRNPRSPGRRLAYAA
jgi:hypothetical protein